MIKEGDNATHVFFKGQEKIIIASRYNSKRAYAQRYIVFKRQKICENFLKDLSLKETTKRDRRNKKACDYCNNDGAPFAHFKLPMPVINSRV